MRVASVGREVAERREGVERKMMRGRRFEGFMVIDEKGMIVSW